MRTAAACALAAIASVWMNSANAAGLSAGVAKADITDPSAGPVNDPLFAKALVVKSDVSTLVIVTIDAVALGEIGRIGNDFVPAVRGRIERELGIKPANVLINASHCHGVVCADVADRTCQAVAEAARNVTPVSVGAGSGREDRVSENRRFQLRDGTEADSRRAYSLPPGDTYVSVAPIDPEIGVLRFDKKDGSTLAAVYNFACHPIEGVPGGGNTADMIGFASKTIEENLGGGAVALFLQGCAGDINPANYKDVDHPHDAEPLGNRLGLSTLRALRGIKTKEDDRLVVINETIELPRSDSRARIAALEEEQTKLVRSLKGTTINLETFVPLLLKYNAANPFPSAYGYRYLHEANMGWDDLKKHDAENRTHIEAYIENIRIMEKLTRLQENLRLLRMHQTANDAAPKRTIDAEIMGVRIGDFVLVTFPGEPTVQIGLDIKQRAPHEFTFVAGYTNGYLYYAPTAEQLRNTGYAQEDCDTILAPEWEAIYKDKAGEMLNAL
jgi:hypothetical protein